MRYFIGGVPLRGALCECQPGAAAGRSTILLKLAKKLCICLFELAIGQQPLAPHTVVAGYTGRSPSAYKFAKDWQQQTEIAKA